MARSGCCGVCRSVTNGAKVIHIRRLKSDPGVNLLS
ncbi:glutathione S-transferase [Salmonella enterica subsp. enterica serovar Gatuni]|nr:glutathione S-transferase [Salmonella enterica subsp. enterica serovar Gatuni]